MDRVQRLRGARRLSMHHLPGTEDDPARQGCDPRRVPDPWMRRASFLAAERMKDPAAVEWMLERLESSDVETRWSAAFVLRRLTGDRIALNPFLPEAEFAAQRQAATAWWERNRAAFKTRPVQSP
ncbi:MAG: hypothetical protein HY716_10735 [Planctomycetes bacterium]|nr:hypothetical protein [Planctomycetota bacterium]